MAHASLDKAPSLPSRWSSSRVDRAGRLCALGESKRGLLVIGAPAGGDTDGEGRIAATIVTESRVPVAIVSGGTATAMAESGASVDEVAA